MERKPPDKQGPYLGATELHDGVVWTWDGAGWTRGRRPGVLRFKRRPGNPSRGNSDPDSRRDRG
jgi:hypothetical protein